LPPSIFSPLPRETRFDLGSHQTLDQTGQICVEPTLQHRSQHLVDEVFERAGIL